MLEGLYSTQKVMYYMWWCKEVYDKTGDSRKDEADIVRSTLPFLDSNPQLLVFFYCTLAPLFSSAAAFLTPLPASLERGLTAGCLVNGSVIDICPWRSHCCCPIRQNEGVSVRTSYPTLANYYSYKTQCDPGCALVLAIYIGNISNRGKLHSTTSIRYSRRNAWHCRGCAYGVFVL